MLYVCLSVFGPFICPVFFCLSACLFVQSVHPALSRFITAPASNPSRGKIAQNWALRLQGKLSIYVSVSRYMCIFMHACCMFVCMSVCFWSFCLSCLSVCLLVQSVHLALSRFITAPASKPSQGKIARNWALRLQGKLSIYVSVSLYMCILMHACCMFVCMSVCFWSFCMSCLFLSVCLSLCPISPPCFVEIHNCACHKAIMRKDCAELNPPVTR